MKVGNILAVIFFIVGIIFLIVSWTACSQILKFIGYLLLFLGYMCLLYIVISNKNKSKTGDGLREP